MTPRLLMEEARAAVERRARRDSPGGFAPKSFPMLETAMAGGRPRRQMSMPDLDDFWGC